MLAGKAIIVTGGGGGIGAAAARRFAESGARVAVVDRQAAAAEEVVSEITASGGTALAIIADVSAEEDVRAMVARTVQAFGRLDGAFNNAGVEQHNVPLHTLTLEQWRRVMSVDLDGVFLCMKHEIPAMLANGGGAIVNTASALGQVAIANASEYVAAKHGVIGVTRAAAVDYATQGVRVNALLPGVIETQILFRLAKEPWFEEGTRQLKARHPLARFGMPNEIAEAALWLLSDASSFVTGTTLSADGGYQAI